MLTLSAEALAAVVEHAARAYPNEACGIIAGPAGQPTYGDVTAGRHIPMANAATEPGRQFAFDPAEQLAVYAEMDARGEDPVVLYHSHPRGPAIPSPTDVRFAGGGTCLWLIVAGMANTGIPSAVRAWRIDDRRIAEEQIQVAQDDAAVLRQG